MLMFIWISSIFLCFQGRALRSFDAAKIFTAILKLAQLFILLKGTEADLPA
jgi:hypothetical protein